MPISSDRLGFAGGGDGQRYLGPKKTFVKSRNQSLDILRRMGVWVSFVACATRLFRMVYRYSVNIFFRDQWSLGEATVFQNHSLIEIFRWQYGPHRLGLGGVLSKIVGPLIRWNSRYESFGIWGVICLACLAAIWLKRRLFGEITYTDAVIPLLFLTPVQYESLLGGTSPSHGPLPLLLVVLYCLAWTIQSDDRWKYSLVLALNFVLIYTGFGLFVGIITPCVAIVEFYRRRNRIALFACAVAVLSLASFFVGYHPETYAGCPVRLEHPIYYFLFVSFMLARFIQVYVSFNLVLAIIIGSLLAFALLSTAGTLSIKLLAEKRPPAQKLIPWILVTYSLLFSFATAYGRSCLGLGAAQGSRYMTYLVLCFFGLYLYALSVSVRIERNVVTAMVVALALLSSARTAGTDRRAIEQTSQQQIQWKDCYLRSRDIKGCDEQSGISIYWTPEPPSLQSKLDFLERNRLNLFIDASP